ncbi:hypothetical protein FACS1894170_06380 [Planctomycetales bacterium]|nr:hypothetical protein FACS1894170_06380 [Planctomycetales bacterium]
MKHILPLVVLFLSASAVFAAAEYTSVEEVAKDAKLNRDFQIQGEYVANINGSINGQTMAVQAVALGGGKFRFLGLTGGLPGNGWKRGSDFQITEFILNDKNELVEKDGFVYKVELDKLIATVEDKQIVLTKQHRASPTLGQKAPEGAVVLFDDGKASDLWEHAVVNEQAKTLWSEAWTKAFAKRPYTLHVEFMTSYMPEARSQGRSNSGVYIDDCYECQILDSFGLDGKNNECGGFYQQAEPLVNMCYPPLAWQTYDIDFVPPKFDAEGKKTVNAKITVKHNGVVIHDKFEPKHETPGRKKETPEARGLCLQGHGNKVQYKNIWLKYN